MRYALTPGSPPAVEPVSLGEAKDWCKVDPDITEDDVLLSALIVAARQLAESQLNRQLITQTWLVSFDTHAVGFSGFYTTSNWVGAVVEIPLSPVQAVTGVSYYDSAGVLTTMDPLTYEVDSAAIRARLRPVWGASWPAMDTRLNGLRIEVIAGYGDTAASVPSAIKIWMRAAIADMYRNRMIMDVELFRNHFMDGLLDPYRIVEI